MTQYDDSKAFSVPAENRCLRGSSPLPGPGFIGVGIMYMNDNLGVGITRIHSGSYEETDEFTQYFNEDLSDIFQYMEYHNIFATGGSIDISKEMLQMTFGPNDTRSFSLNDIIKYLKSLATI